MAQQSEPADTSPSSEGSKSVVRLQDDTEIYFQDLPENQREEILDSLHGTVSQILSTPPPFSAPWLQLVGIRLAVVIGVPLVLAIFLLQLAHTAEPIPILDQPQTQAGTLTPNGPERPSSSAEYEAYRRQRELDFARHHLERVMLLIAFGLVTVVFLRGHALLAAAQRGLRYAWRDIEWQNEALCQDDERWRG